MSAAAPRDEADIDVDVLRDTLTREWLAVAAASRHLDVVGYDSHWWDGQTWAHCLVVAGAHGRERIVEDDGAAVVVPFARRKAARILAARRKPTPPSLVVPEPRMADHDISVDATDDVLRCRSASCAALIPIAAPQCPRCGGAVER